MMLVVVGGFLLFRLVNGSDVNLLWVLAVAGIAVVALFIYRAFVSRKDRQRRELIERADVGSLTEKVESMLGDTANKILEVEDRPDLSDSREATRYFQKSVAAFASVDDRLESAVTVAQLRSLIVELDDALWGLEAAEAVLAGTPLPERTQTLPAEPTPRPPTAIPLAPSEAIARWMDGGTGRHQRRRGRSC